MKKTMRNLTPVGKILLMLSVSKAQAVHAPEPLPPLNDLKFLRAVAAVESGTTDLTKPFRKVGKRGERSAWQICEAVWKQYTREPFAKASTDAALAQTIAHLHLQHLKYELECDRIAQLPFILGIAWNGGMGYVTDKTPSRRMEDYAKRVSRLYHSE